MVERLEPDANILAVHVPCLSLVGGEQRIANGLIHSLLAIPYSLTR
jgi:hypothetical protein